MEDTTALSRLMPAEDGQVRQLQRLQDSEAPEARFRLFDAVARFLGSLAQRQPQVVIIDDLQSADLSSLLLLELVARQLRELSLLVLATLRDAGDPAFSKALVDLGREPRTERLVLRGLSVDDVAELVHATVRVSPAAALVARLHEQTEGTPLFLSEYIRLLLTRGGVALQDPRSGLRMAMPGSVQAVVRQRQAPLSPACRDVLRTAAVIEREFRADLLPAARGGGDAEALRAALVEAEAARVVEPADTPDRYCFAHTVIRDALYADVHAAERRRLHGAIAAAIEQLADAGAYVAELAHHCSAAGDDARIAKAAAYARQAADRAPVVFAYEEAERLYRLALDTLERAGHRDARPRVELLLALGGAQNRAGDSERAK